MAYQLFKAWVAGDFHDRLHHGFDPDLSFVGPFVFGNPDAQADANSNRIFLLEICDCNLLAVANTFFHYVPEKQATYYNVGANLGSDLTHKKFGQEDLVLISRDYLSAVGDVLSHKHIP